MKRAAIIMVAAMALAGCETTGNVSDGGNTSVPIGGFSQSQQTALGSNGVATTTSQIDPATGQRVVTGGSFSFGSGNVGMASAMIGRWTLGDDYARRCTLSLNTTPLAGGSGAWQAQQTGFCSGDFSAVSGWMAAGSGIALTDSAGRIQGQLVADAKRDYVGTFNTTFGPSTVRLSRGGF